MKKTIFTLITGLLMFVRVTGVMADGTTTKETCTTNQYGDTTCTTTTEKPEVVVHEPVDTALGDNPLLLATLLFGAGYIAYKASEKVVA